MSTTSPGTTAGDLPKPWYIKHIWILAAVVGVLSLTILRTCGGRKLATLPTLGNAPAFVLTAQDGAAFDSKALTGKVWIASFFFTSCRTECPIIGRSNQEVQKALAGTDVKLLSFSVDPEFDTPERLIEWGRLFGADHARWTLLTGPRKELERVAMEGFKTAMGERITEGKGGLVEIAHTMKLILVDANGFIRYYFDAANPEAMSLIVDHARALEREFKDAEKNRQ